MRLTDGRLGELRQLMDEERTELGPLDRDDIREALSELLDRRIDETGHSERVAA
jgi:hypothetical protein